MKNSFRTILDTGSSRWKIEHGDHIVTIGSCFSKDIGQLLTDHKFHAMVNPFGTVYNPISITRLLQWAVDLETPSEGYMKSNDAWVNLHFHSDFTGLEKQELQQKIHHSIEETHHFLKKAKWLVITLGTSWVYRHKELDMRVSNCHKIPNKEFTKELLNPREVIRPLEEVSERLKAFNPSLNIIYTVSPVRHTRDGIPENQVSKSILRIACHYLEQDLDFAEYFPSYEIVLDDLRDYRFYQSDMIHPSSEAIEYIWESFSSKYFSTETQKLNTEIKSVVSALNHRAFNPNSNKHRAFLQQTMDRLKLLEEKVNFEKEINELEAKITSLEG